MDLKDYYTILGLQPSATTTEIKRAYRRLAQLHHPDKNNNTPLSVLQFAEIKEAYQVLTTPSKKEIYLQQRWYNQSIGKKKAADFSTPETILKDLLSIEKYISLVDHYRMDKKGLLDNVYSRFDDGTIEKLNIFNDKEINKKIILTTLDIIKVLQVNMAQPLIEKLFLIASGDKKLKLTIETRIEKQRKKEKLRALTPVIILLLTLFLCFLIWISSKV